MLLRGVITSSSSGSGSPRRLLDGPVGGGTAGTASRADSDAKQTRIQASLLAAQDAIARAVASRNAQTSIPRVTQANSAVVRAALDNTGPTFDSIDSAVARISDGGNRRLLQQLHGVGGARSVAV
jgi:hypothetical protein